MSDLLIRGAGRVITMAGGVRRGSAMQDPGALTQVDVLARAGVIAQVGRDIVADCETIEAEGRLVTPGLVDAHTHLVFVGHRAAEAAMRREGATYQEIAAAGGGIRSSMRALRAATETELVAETRRHADWMLRSGTTTAEAKTGYGLDLESELRSIRAMRAVEQLEVVPTWLGLHAIPPEFASREEYVEYALQTILPAVAPHAEYADAFIESGYFQHEDAKRLAQAARAHGLSLRLHVDQMAEDGGAALAAELGATSADHLEQTGPDGIAALAASSTAPILLPASVFGLGLSRFPDARAMVAAGLPVVLATDFNPGSAPCPSLLAAMSLACAHMRMRPAETLAACTINAAASLGRAHRIGSIEPGKQADLVLWDAEHEDELPYWLGAPLVRAVIKRGTRVV
jgi:imidazolonepropionase